MRNRQGSHSEDCRLRFEKVRVHETEFENSGDTTTTAPAMSSAPTSVPSIEAHCEMEGGVCDGEIDVLMLVKKKQLTV